MLDLTKDMFPCTGTWPIFLSKEDVINNLILEHFRFLLRFPIWSKFTTPSGQRVSVQMGWFHQGLRRRYADGVLYPSVSRLPAHSPGAPTSLFLSGCEFIIFSRWSRLLKINGSNRIIWLWS